MTMAEQVNPQELQRLNEAIMITLDALRRVAPQIAQMGQQAAQGGGLWGQAQGGNAGQNFGQNPGQNIGQGFGQNAGQGFGQNLGQNAGGFGQHQQQAFDPIAQAVFHGVKHALLATQGMMAQGQQGQQGQQHLGGYGAQTPFGIGGQFGHSGFGLGSGLGGVNPGQFGSQYAGQYGGGIGLGTPQMQAFGQQGQAAPWQQAQMGYGAPYVGQRF